MRVSRARRARADILRRLISSNRIIALCAALSLAGCEHFYGNTQYADPPVPGPYTYTHSRLSQLPPLGPPITVAVYGFPDLTGQNKFTPGINYAELSKAVTQGGGTLLIDVLRSAGNGTWFDVVERPQVDDLLRERKLIEDARSGKTAVSKKRTAETTDTNITGSINIKKREARDSVLPPLKFADYLFAGGITGYDLAYLTGGIGATYLGIGGNVGYQKDIVNVTLRLIDVLTGKVVSSVNTSKAIYSFQASPTVFHYVSVSNLLTVEGSGVTTAEPVLLAVREAMELALYEMLAGCYQQPTWCGPKPYSPSQYRPARPIAELRPPSGDAPAAKSEWPSVARPQPERSAWPAVAANAPSQ